MDPEIADFYDLGKERERLDTWGRLERLRTRELLDRYLPPPPAVVLDIGGGAGAYAHPLAAAGYEVHLLDPIALHVEQARAAGDLASAAVGDARALPYEDRSADAALLLGPLYHLTEEPERTQALREALRTLRPGGVLLAAAISRFASTMHGLLQEFLADPAFEAIVERDLADGQHRNPDRNPRWFTTGYFHHPDGLAQEVSAAGFDLGAILAIEGPVGIPGEIGHLSGWLDDPARHDTLLRAIRRVEAEPSLLGASPHLLAVATRP